MSSAGKRIAIFAVLAVFAGILAIPLNAMPTSTHLPRIELAAGWKYDISCDKTADPNCIQGGICMGLNQGFDIYSEKREGFPFLDKRTGPYGCMAETNNLAKALNIATAVITSLVIVGGGSMIYRANRRRGRAHE